MKAVDVVVELAEGYIYIEIKDFHDPERYDFKSVKTDGERKDRRVGFNYLKNYLKYKYRDSYLYRCAEHKVDKPVHYICLLSLDNALAGFMGKVLKRELPVGQASKRWKQGIVESCQVVNFNKWNEAFPKWPVTRIAK